jgi:hypothetical protein
MPFPEIAEELYQETGDDIYDQPRSTLEHIFHEHHHIFRRKAPRKLDLSLVRIEACIAFGHMALQIAIHLIVFTDEIWIVFRAAQRQGNVLELFVKAVIQKSRLFTAKRKTPFGPCFGVRSVWHNLACHIMFGGHRQMRAERTTMKLSIRQMMRLLVALNTIKHKQQYQALGNINICRI